MLINSTSNLNGTRIFNKKGSLFGLNSVLNCIQNRKVYILECLIQYYNGESRGRTKMKTELEENQERTIIYLKKIIEDNFNKLNYDIKHDKPTNPNKEWNEIIELYDKTTEKLQAFKEKLIKGVERK